MVRPGHTLRICILTGHNGTTDVIQEINIEVDGTVSLTGVANVATGKWITLNSITFLAEQ